VPRSKQAQTHDARIVAPVVCGLPDYPYFIVVEDPVAGLLGIAGGEGYRVTLGFD